MIYGPCVHPREEPLTYHIGRANSRFSEETRAEVQVQDMWKNNLANDVSNVLATMNTSHASKGSFHNAERDHKGNVGKNAKRAVHSFLFGTTEDDDDADDPPL